MSKAMTFTDEQSRAVSSQRKRIIVISPPGTGKTHVVTGRFVRDTQLHGGNSVIAVSFTRKAAAEISERIEAAGIRTDPTFPSTGTFHSVALMILNLATERGLYDGPTTLASEETRDQIIGRFCTVQPTDDIVLVSQNKALKHSRRELSSMIENVKRKGYTPVPGGYRFVTGQMASAVGTLPNADCALHGRMVNYQQALEAENVLDYSDALIAATALIARTDRRRIILPSLATVIVDEYQDSDAVNEMMIRSLAHDITLVCCCDDDQSIYRWRGANSNLVHSFTDTWDDSERIVLGHNFRSPPSIRILADNLMAPVANRTPKTTLEERQRASGIEKDVSVYFMKSLLPYRARTEGVNSTLADFTADVVTRLVANGTEPHDIAVLARTHDAIQEITKALNRRSIPSRASNPNRTTSAEIRHLQAWLELLNHTNQLHAVATVCRMETGNRTLRDYHDYARSTGVTLTDFLIGRLAANKLRAENYREPMNRMAALTAMAKGKSVTEVLEHIVSLILKDFEPYMNTARENTFWAAYHLLVPTANISGKGDFGLTLNALSTAISDDTLRPSAGHVGVSTVHHMKGRQAPHIVLCALVDDIIPSSSSTRAGPRSEEMNEERRLTYVAYTRTMKHLHIISVQDAKSTFIEDTFAGLNHALSGTSPAGAFPGLASPGKAELRLPA